MVDSKGWDFLWLFRVPKVLKAVLFPVFLKLGYLALLLILWGTFNILIEYTLIVIRCIYIYILIEYTLIVIRYIYTHTHSHTHNTHLECYLEYILKIYNTICNLPFFIKKGIESIGTFTTNKLHHHFNSHTIFFFDKYFILFWYFRFLNIRSKTVMNLKYLC